MTRIFLDTSILSNRSLNELATKLSERVSSGDQLLISVLTHFEVLWGYRTAKLSSSNYDNFLDKLHVEVAPLLDEDAVLAAVKKPKKGMLVDALIAATVTRYDAILWTKDRDFGQFLPDEKITLL